jgi:hypothetical protein
MEIAVKQIIEEHDKLEMDIKEIERGLVSLRGQDWQNGATKDERLPVKILLATLNDMYVAREKLLNHTVCDFSFEGPFKKFEPEEGKSNEFIPEI